MPGSRPAQTARGQSQLRARAIQREPGGGPASIPSDQTLGSWVWAGERVLAGGTLTGFPLIEESFSCPDIETVASALLERGPVIAGLGWHDSMTTPEEVDGQVVCRVEGEARGGHAILLNGIDLDLELGSVRGFVRFKTWGPEWGDNGHALVSIHDLAKLLESASDVLLPSPREAPSAPAGDRTSPRRICRRRLRPAVDRQRPVGRSSTPSATAPTPRRSRAGSSTTRRGRR